MDPQSINVLAATGARAAPPVYTAGVDADAVAEGNTIVPVGIVRLNRSHTSANSCSKTAGISPERHNGSSAEPTRNIYVRSGAVRACLHTRNDRVEDYVGAETMTSLVSRCAVCGGDGKRVAGALYTDISKHDCCYTEVAGRGHA